MTDGFGNLGDRAAAGLELAHSPAELLQGIAEALAQERAIFQQKESEGRRRFEAELLRKDEALRDSEKLKLQIEEARVSCMLKQH